MLSTDELILENEQEEIDTSGAPDTSAAQTPENVEPETDGEIDYERVLCEDLRELSKESGDGKEITVSDLKNPVRYGALRDLGLSPKEAFLATGGLREREDNRAHLYSSVPRMRTGAYKDMPRAHLEIARELFDGMSDGEIRSLYKKVTQ